MLKRYIPFVIAAIVAVFAGIYQSQPASAAVNYDFEYNFANVYNTGVIDYTFSNLDATTTYTWGVYTVSTVSGGTLNLFGTFTSTPDDRSGSPTDEVWQFGGVDFSTPLGTVNFPQGYNGPIAVLDMSNGTVIGRHFVAELPTFITTPDSDWLSSAGVTTAGEKQVIGPNQFQGSCRNPVYNEINVNGWMHSFTPCSVTTIENGWALLHYQVTSAYDPASDDDILRFYLIPDSTIVFSIQLDQLIAFQVTGTYTPGTARQFFIVINTNGSLLPFIDNTRCANEFSSAGNPCISSFDPGVYNYSRYDSSPAWVSDGESVWIVTQDPSLQEWTIQADNNDVLQNGTARIRINSTTEAVWDSYHGSQELVDSEQGTIDTTVYAFSLTRQYPYTAGSTLGDVTASWTVEPSALESGSATPAEMGFTIQTIYEITDFPSFEENVNNVLANTGLDTDSGRAAVLTIILFVGMLGTAAFPGIRGNIFAYLVVWTGLGGVFVLGGFGTVLVNTVFIIMTIVMWLFAILMLQTGWEDELD